jgi:hypothetical protein
VAVGLCRTDLEILFAGTEHQLFIMDFSFPERQFKDIVPVTLSCWINDCLLTKFHCQRTGNYHLEEPVPSSWLTNATPTIVKAVLDRVWIPPADGARLSYLILRAGFRGRQ